MSLSRLSQQHEFVTDSLVLMDSFVAGSDHAITGEYTFRLVRLLQAYISFYMVRFIYACQIYCFNGLTEPQISVILLLFSGVHYKCRSAFGAIE